MNSDALRFTIEVLEVDRCPVKVFSDFTHERITIKDMVSPPEPFKTYLKIILFILFPGTENTVKIYINLWKLQYNTWYRLFTKNETLVFQFVKAGSIR